MFSRPTTRVARRDRLAALLLYAELACAAVMAVLAVVHASTVAVVVFWAVGIAAGVGAWAAS